MIGCLCIYIRTLRKHEHVVRGDDDRSGPHYYSKCLRLKRAVGAHLLSTRLLDHFDRHCSFVASSRQQEYAVIIDIMTTNAFDQKSFLFLGIVYPSLADRNKSPRP